MRFTDSKLSAAFDDLRKIIGKNLAQKDLLLIIMILLLEKLQDKEKDFFRSIYISDGIEDINETDWKKFKAEKIEYNHNRAVELINLSFPDSSKTEKDAIINLVEKKHEENKKLYNEMLDDCRTLKIASIFKLNEINMESEEIIEVINKQCK